MSGDWAEVREIDQALAAIATAFTGLNSASHNLDSARTWSRVDTWMGGGLIASLVKRDRIGRANQSLNWVDTLLVDVRRELADVHIASVGDVGIGTTAGTLDVWFDNLLSDLFTRSRIVSSQERVNAVGRVLVQVQSDLRRRRAALVAELETETEASPGSGAAQ